MSSFGSYKLQSGPTVQKAEKAVAKDSLLADFTPGQRDYIINNLYPTLK